MHSVMVTSFGAFLGKESERLVVKKGEEVLQEVPFFRVNEIILPARGAALSTEVISEACRRGIRIALLDGGGRPYAMLTSPYLTATVATRRAQMEAYGDGRSVRIGRAMAAGKVGNQSGLLKYFGKYLKGTDGERFARLAELIQKIEEHRKTIEGMEGERVDAVREEIMGHEGAAGALYWEGVKVVLEGRYVFPGREQRGTEDPLNAGLNYGYGILYSQVWGAVLQAGLEPFAGFLHVDRPGKPSLVLDLVEEFRQPVADRTILGLVSRRERLKMEEGLLDGPSRKLVAQKVLERLDSEVAFEGKRRKVRSVIQLQARHLAVALRGEREYRTYRFKW